MNPNDLLALIILCALIGFIFGGVYLVECSIYAKCHVAKTLGWGNGYSYGENRGTRSTDDYRHHDLYRNTYEHPKLSAAYDKGFSLGCTAGKLAYDERKRREIIRQKNVRTYTVAQGKR